MFFSKTVRPRVIYMRTRDGWRLATYRYQPNRPTSPWGPVLLVHGLSANRFDLDAPDPRISLARYLHERGHDVWVAELRGAGKSRPPGWPLPGSPQFDFDDYVHRDAPALIRGIMDHTGSSALHWVGHSMGGMLAYAALEHFDQRLFRSVVTIGSPAFTAVKHPAADLLYRLKFMLKVVPWLPNRQAARFASWFPGIVRRTFGHIVANPDNMETRHIRSLLRNAQSNLPARLMEQFAEWYGGPGGFTRYDGLKDYHAHLKHIRAPMLIMAGACDELTPVEDLRQVHDLISSPDKKFLVCGVENGFSRDYGHIDMVLGKRAREEVYPHISGWIEEHTGPNVR